MIETPNPEINVDELMARIREEATRQPLTQNRGGIAPLDLTSGPFAVALPRSPEPPLLDIQTDYALADFLNFYDAAFIRQAYRGILGREPDAHGLQNYLERLHSGRVSKVEILGRLRYSPEGRARAVRVHGLLLPLIVAVAGRWPVVGYIWRWLAAWLRLPVFIGNFQRFESDAARRFEQQSRLFNQGMTGCERALAELNAAKADARTLAAALARIEALERQLQEPSLASVMPQHPVDSPTHPS